MTGLHPGLVIVVSASRQASGPDHRSCGVRLNLSAQHEDIITLHHALLSLVTVKTSRSASEGSGDSERELDHDGEDEDDSAELSMVPPTSDDPLNCFPFQTLLPGLRLRITRN